MAANDPASGVMHVMAGLLIDADKRVLLAQRLPGKHLAGMWEFPGGKLEPGEAPLEALKRELHEELGITLLRASPLVQVPWNYGERDLLLDAWLVEQWQDTPRSLEGQALQWLPVEQVDATLITPADGPILQTLLTSLGF
jgi:mutator protein MutT